MGPALRQRKEALGKQRRNSLSPALAPPRMEIPLFCLAPKPSHLPSVHRSRQPRHRAGCPHIGGVCVLVVLFGWKQRPFRRDQACLLSSRPFWNWVWGEVFAAQGKTIKQLCSPPPHVTHFEPSVSWGERVCQDRPGAEAHQHSTTKSEPVFLKEGGQHDTLRAPAGWAPPAVGTCVLDRWVWTHWVPAAPLLSRPLGASGPLRVQRALRRWADGWVTQGRSRANRRGGRGTSVWAGVPGVGPGPGGRVAPPGFGSSTGLSQKTPVAVDR